MVQSSYIHHVSNPDGGEGLMDKTAHFKEYDSTSANEQLDEEYKPNKYGEPPTYKKPDPTEEEEEDSNTTYNWHKDMPGRHNLPPSETAFEGSRFNIILI